MKKLLLVMVVLALVVGCKEAAAETVQVLDRHYGHTHMRDVTVHDPVIVPDHVENYEKFDIGAFLDLVLFETKDKNIEIISRNTWELNRDQYTSLIGAKIKVWSLFKKDE